MWKIMFLTCWFVLMNSVLKCEASQKICKEKEKSLALFELAKDLIKKAEYYKPHCDEANTTHQKESLCRKMEKSATYLEMALELIKEAENNYPLRHSENAIQHVKEKSDNDTLPLDCVEVQQRGQHQSGIYTIQLNTTANINKTVNVYCDMDTDGGGWTVIQRRQMSSYERFHRSWHDYKHGFGDLKQQFWIGNDMIHALTNTGSNAARFDMRDLRGDTAYAFYNYFTVTNETDGYRLYIGNYTGNAGDSMMKYSNMARFSTRDRLNDGNEECPPIDEKGGWWSKGCIECNPNGMYRPGNKGIRNIFWNTWRGQNCLTFFEIKIRNY